MSGVHELKLLSIPWDKFKPTYRGREVADPGPLKTNHVKRVSIMMRRYVRNFLERSLFSNCRWTSGKKAEYKYLLLDCYPY